MYAVHWVSERLDLLPHPNLLSGYLLTNSPLFSSSEFCSANETHQSFVNDLSDFSLKTRFTRCGTVSECT